MSLNLEPREGAGDDSSARPWRRIVPAAAAVLAGATALLLSACGPEAAQRDEASGEVTAASDADVFSVQVGDCLDMAKIASAAEVETVPTQRPGQRYDVGRG